MPSHKAGPKINSVSSTSFPNDVKRLVGDLLPSVILISVAICETVNHCVSRVLKKICIVFHQGN